MAYQPIEKKWPVASQYTGVILPDQGDDQDTQDKKPPTNYRKSDPGLNPNAPPQAVSGPVAYVPPTQGGLVDEMPFNPMLKRSPTDAESAGPGYDEQASDMWSNLLAGYDASLGGKMQQTYADEAGAGRKADAMNAMLGRGVAGGGYQAGQAQVALGGMAQRQDTLNQHTRQGLQMKMTYLESLIRRAEAGKDRALQEKLQAEADKTLLLLNEANVDPTQYEEDEETSANDMPGGDTDAYPSGGVVNNKGLPDWIERQAWKWGMK